MARYRLDLKYDGSPYAGWQRQNNAITVQEVIENSLYTKLQEKIDVIGCGRTDAGVHASHYVLHFDSDQKIDEHILFGLNNILPNEIAIDSITQVREDFHARFDATRRSYVYLVHALKDPFLDGRSFYYHRMQNIDLLKMEDLASRIKGYKAFSPFCKSHTDVKTMKCAISEMYWIHHERSNQYEFHISADRFLRGMVRLIVGASIQVGLGVLSIADIEHALIHQSELPKAWSVPAHGLYLREIVY